MAETKKIHTDFMKVGLCPVCGEEIMDPQSGVGYFNYREVELKLSNGSVMKQPFCSKDLGELTQETLIWVWKCIKLQWETEIKENQQLSEEDKEKELKRISSLEVIYP